MYRSGCELLLVVSSQQERKVMHHMFDVERASILEEVDWSVPFRCSHCVMILAMHRVMNQGTIQADCDNAITRCISKCEGTSGAGTVSGPAHLWSFLANSASARSPPLAPGFKPPTVHSQTGNGAGEAAQRLSSVSSLSAALASAPCAWSLIHVPPNPRPQAPTVQYMYSI